MIPLYIYLTGVFVTLVLLGAWGGTIAKSDVMGISILAATWPIFLFGGGIWAICYAPILLGTQLRKLFE